MGSGNGKGVRAIGTADSNADPVTLPAEAAGSGKHRSSPWTEVAGIAGAIFRVLGIESKPNILQVLSETIIIRAELDGCSVELAANKLAGRAAVVAKTPPEAWEQWFADARYDYVPQGDKRINQRGQMARPVCGGALCSEGWEPVLVGGVRRLRRCPDCLQVWKDAGLE